MRVLFTGLFPIWQCHFVGECNFIEEHLGVGDEVDVLACDASLLKCDANPERELPNCLTCMGIRESAVSMLSKPLRRRKLISDSAQAKLVRVSDPDFQCMQELKAFSVFGTNVGADVISSIMTALGDPCFDVSENSERIKKTIRDYLGVYLTAREYLDGGHYSLVYVFNGRFAAAKAWIRACEHTNTDYYTMERLGMPDRVLKIKNCTVHAICQYTQWIKDFWEKNKEDELARKEAVDFFDERPQGLMTGWYSYIENQDKKRLPEEWDPECRNMAVFSSTETEFAGIPEILTGALYKDQKKCYLQIAKLLQEKDPSIHLHLRIHPNSKTEKRRWWEDSEFRNLNNLTIILPESSVSSYELMRSCEKTVVFMTTMGIEATYWGKPSILLSNSMYKGIGAIYEPEGEAEAIDLICHQNLEPKPKEATLAYGGFLRVGYPKLPYSEALDHCTLTFKGIRPNASQLAIKALWRWENFIKPSRIPNFLKQAWQVIEWHRIRLINKLRV